MGPLFRPAMMPSPPSATALTAAASVTIENTTSAPPRGRAGADREPAVRARRGRARARRIAHAGGDERLGLRLAAVPTRNRVAGGHKPGDDAGTHRTEPNETDIHACDLARSRKAR